MNPTIITALVSGLCVAVPTIISVIVTSNAHDAVVDERIKYLSEKIETLTAKVTLHNNFGERISLVERDLKTAFKRIDELKEMKK